MAYKTMAYRRGAWHTYGLHRKPCETQPNGLRGEPEMTDRGQNLPDQKCSPVAFSSGKLKENLCVKMILSCNIFNDSKIQARL